MIPGILFTSPCGDGTSLVENLRFSFTHTLSLSPLA